MKQIIWIVASFILVVSCNKTDDLQIGEVTYRVTLKSAWSAETHPNNFPENAEISPFVAFSHQEHIDFFSVNDFASPGLKALAETGSLSPIDNEIGDIISAGNAIDIVTSTRIASPGETFAELGFSKDAHFGTIMAKLSPSPDWFIAIKNVSLLDENGNWVDNKEVYLTVYDAGTDLGSDYDAEDNSSPKPFYISELHSGPLSNEDGTINPIASVQFQKITY